MPHRAKLIIRPSLSCVCSLAMPRTDFVRAAKLQEVARRSLTQGLDVRIDPATLPLPCGSRDRVLAGMAALRGWLPNSGPLLPNRRPGSAPPLDSPDPAESHFGIRVPHHSASREPVGHWPSHSTIRFRSGVSEGFPEFPELAPCVHIHSAAAHAGAAFSS